MASSDWESRPLAANCNEKIVIATILASYHDAMKNGQNSTNLFIFSLIYRFFFFFFNLFFLKACIRTYTKIIRLFSAQFLKNVFYSEIRDTLWDRQKPLSMPCLFLNLSHFVQASIENKATYGKCYSQKSLTPRKKFFRKFLPSFFLSFLLISPIF